MHCVPNQIIGVHGPLPPYRAPMHALVRQILNGCC